LKSLGLYAVSVIHEDASGKPVYSAWLGGAADAGQMALVKSGAQSALPGFQLTEVDMRQPYLIVRSDVTGGAQSPIPHYAFNAEGQKVAVSVKDALLQVKERFNRTYRGMMELSQYRGKLAVVNELPFEAYLYSVVGSEMGSGWPAEALKA